MSPSSMQTYARLPVGFTHGEGPWLWGTDGRKYLDLLSGLGVCGLGHAHPVVTRALSEQAGRLLHTSNLYGIPHQSGLADKLARLFDPSDPSSIKAFFCNSGTEANEAAIKIARRHGHNRGIESPGIIVAEGSFHGRTLAALSATGNEKIQAGFEPLVSGFLRVPFNDAAAIAALAGNPDVVAVLVEPIQGEGGVVVPDDDYLEAVRRICDEHGWLMMLDEVQTGMGRTGRWFAWQHAGTMESAMPDVMLLAKALGNGVPIGVCLARGPAGEVLTPGSHGSTFGGNPLACRTALAVIEVMEREGLVERAGHVGNALRSALTDALGGRGTVSEIRGKGLMIGVQFHRPCTELVGRALERGLLINVTAGNVLRLLPPLILGEQELARIVETIAELERDL
uniref:Acetylornithine aminotransferase n=1 Tax=Candidatus Kentrum sp. FM TaxID=2126340 RepID=A0A450T208_9GAMM|nr:MAG: acetylornithine aminotransferase [Candidatus Kentron sp. FM]VFJ60549.1 MAG: acetylornithine aminotransferase [Candidatus Kentron sp. FM]VFK12768.1 MAG: acetylornithine aminotransferase [Candidatus Kentron sp. FM]